MKLLPSLLALALLPAGQALAAPAEGQPAPAFQARLLDGRALDSAALRGKVVLLHYWATWCPPCREEMPALEAFYRKHRQEGLEIVAVSVEEADDEARVRDFARGVSFPVALAEKVQAEGYGRIWRLPLSFLSDRHGVLRKTNWSGTEKMDEAGLEKAVTPLLKAP